MFLKETIIAVNNDSFFRLNTYFVVSRHSKIVKKDLIECLVCGI